MASVTRVLILGGGFGGLAVAREIERHLGDDARVHVTLVNRENYFLFTPMLHEVAASDLEITNIVSPLRQLLRRTELFTGSVEHIDLHGRTVIVSHGGGHHHHELPYDHLVLALGSTTNFFTIPGLRERALTMKSLGDAILLRNRIIELLEEADFECCADHRAPLVTFVVAGGGFAGVETVAAMNDFARDALRYYPHLDARQLRVVLVHPGGVILPELGEQLGRYAQQQLERRGVEIRVNTRVAGVDGNVVRLSDGTEIVAETLVWTAGTSANPLLASLDCGKDRGRIVVDDCLRVPGWPNVWALGDCASVPNPATGMPHPPTAQHAVRQGRTLGTNIVAAITGKPAREFRFSTLGLLASIGRRTGVANMLGYNFSGFIAWWLWRTIYLGKLPRLEKKFRVALDWTLDVIFSKDLVQFGTGRAPVLAHAEDEESVGATHTRSAREEPVMREAS